MKNPNSTNTIRDLEGKVAIVTGAASGIGLATARLLMERGAYLVAEDINPKVMELLGADDTSVGFVSDVSKEQAATDVVALAVKRFGKLDILVNNARASSTRTQSR